MRLRHRSASLTVVIAAAVVAGLAAGIARGEDAQLKPAIRAVEEPGTYKSRNERCGATLTVADIGEYRVLTITRDGSVIHSVNGATALAWLHDNRLIYSTSAIMGEGGLFVYNCATGKTAPINTHIQGDVFHLFGVSPGEKPIIFFYVSEDISGAHGGWARYEIGIDGSGLKQIQ